MTQHNDNTHIKYHLTPAEKKIFDIGWNINHDLQAPRPFCYGDFPYSHGTIRNVFSKLNNLKLIYLVYRSSIAFYACKGSRIRTGSMTSSHMVGRGRKQSLEEILCSLGDAVTGVHDIRLLFHSSGIYSALHLIPAKYSKDKKLSIQHFEKGRIVRVVVHRTDSVSVQVSCSRFPFPRDNLDELIFVLDKVRDYIQFNCFSEPIQISLVADWIVTNWHYNKDGEEICGERFKFSFQDYSGVFYQFYAKSAGGNRFRPRLEKNESPKKTLRELAEEILQRP